MKPAIAKRRSYTASFKLQVIEVAKQKGNRAAGRQFSLDESTIRGWRKLEAKIKSMPAKKLADRGRKAKHPVLEENLKAWIVAQRDNGRGVSTLKIRLQALAMAKEMNLVEFGANPSWCHRFMRRHNLSVRSTTTVGQRLPADWEDKTRAFQTFVNNLQTENSFPASKVGNMDEVPVSFDAPSSRTVDEVGKKTIRVTTTGNEKTNFTAVLSCLADGTKLKPLLIFKRKTLPKESLPQGCVVTCNEKGWMNQEVMRLWAERVWRGRPGAFFNPEGVLIMDSMRAHLTDGIKELFKGQKTKLAIIPGGLTCKLQPLDVGVNKAFKCYLRQEWESWMCDGLHSYTATGKMRRATIPVVCEWVVSAWAKVKATSVTNAYKNVALCTHWVKTVRTRGKMRRG